MKFKIYKHNVQYIKITLNNNNNIYHILYYINNNYYITLCKSFTFFRIKLFESSIVLIFMICFVEITIKLSCEEIERYYSLWQIFIPLISGKGGKNKWKIRRNKKRQERL